MKHQWQWNFSNETVALVGSTVFFLVQSGPNAWSCLFRLARATALSAWATVIILEILSS
jgi:hypothetical protein